jgi:putative flippase GtrA
LPSYVRFGLVGCMGLLTDTLAFTVFFEIVGNPFLARLMSLAIATFVTWTLNRQLTFDIQQRELSNEAARYLTVTLFAQGLSYSTFAFLVSFAPQIIPQLSLLTGALVGAFISFNGHRFVSFAPIQKSFTKG